MTRPRRPSAQPGTNRETGSSTASFPSATSRPASRPVIDLALDMVPIGVRYRGEYHSETTFPR